MKKASIIKILPAVLGLLVLCACTSIKPLQGATTINSQADLLGASYKLLIIDRFEGDYAVCEDEKLNMVNVKKTLIPADAPEGAELNNNYGIIEYDKNDTDFMNE